MPTTIFFNGRVISVPGSYSEVDASGLEGVGLGAAGIVAVLGDAEGGIPASAITSMSQLIRINKPEQGRSTFRSGNLREAIDMLFAPAKDPDILAGAQQVVAMKVNPAVQSTLTLGNAQGDAIDLTSEDYGAFTEQINISIASGTSKGKLITIIFEDVTESEDDVGGDNMFTLQYTPGSLGWNDSMTAQVTSGGNITANGTRDESGLDGDLDTTLAAPGAIEVLSADGSDTNQVIIFGLDGSGNPIREKLTLNGTTPVVGSETYAAGDVLGVHVVGTSAGNVTVRPSGGGSSIFVTTAGVDAVDGLVRGVGMYVSGTAVTLVADGATTADVIIAGTNASGTEIEEKITLTGTTAVAGSGLFGNITHIVLADVAAARTVTVSAQAALSQQAVNNTLQKAADFFNAKWNGSVGFEFTMVTGRTTFNPNLLDVMPAAVDIASPAEPGFLADLNAVVEWINTNSSLMTAVASSGASGGAPSNTSTAQFLSGGSEGTTAFSHYQTALNLLKQTRINTIVPLTSDPAVHAAVDAHCAYMSGIGRSERDAVVGLENAAQTNVPTKTEAKAQVVALNSRHIRAWAQAVERYNTAGERAEFETFFGAACVAGMQAGSPVGTSLTFKYMNILSFRQDTTWNPMDDAEELIQAGLVFAENVEGVGRRIVRNITTHLSTDNIAFTEASVNEAVNFAVFNFRTNMEFAVGRPGFSGTVNGAKSVAIGTLGLLVAANTLTAYRSLFIDLVVDVMEVEVEMAPVIPVNFVKNTIHLVAVPQTAAT